MNKQYGANSKTQSLWVISPNQCDFIAVIPSDNEIALKQLTHHYPLASRTRRHIDPKADTLNTLITHSKDTQLLTYCYYLSASQTRRRIDPAAGTRAAS